MKCSKCGENLPLNAKYCPNCGTIVDFTPVCINGHKMQRGQKFCCECGSPLDVSEESNVQNNDEKSNNSEGEEQQQRNDRSLIRKKKIEKFLIPLFQSLITIGAFLLVLVIIQECKHTIRKNKIEGNDELARIEEYKDTEIIDGNNTATTRIINGHECVDLGLTSGLKWASCNIGASKPSQYGNYYSWGETTHKETYDTFNVTRRMNDYELLSKGIINSSGNLTKPCDAAQSNWGATWRMPTKEECEELRNRCNWSYDSLDGVKGYRITGPNGNSIFIPCAGFRNDYRNKLTRREGLLATIWSSTSGGDDHAGYQNIGQAFSISVENLRDFGVYTYRNYGLPIRAVSE